MKKKYVLIIISGICFILLLFLILPFLCPSFIPFRVYYKEPVIEDGKVWCSNVNNICFKSTYKEEIQSCVLSGTIILNDDTIDVEIQTKTGNLYFFCEQHSVILKCKYKFKRNGDIVLKNITYSEEVDWELTPKKIVLKEQPRERTQGDGSVS